MPCFTPEGVDPASAYRTKSQLGAGAQGVVSAVERLQVRSTRARKRMRGRW